MFALQVNVCAASQRLRCKSLVAQMVAVRLVELMMQTSHLCAHAGGACLFSQSAHAPAHEERLLLSSSAVCLAHALHRWLTGVLWLS